MILFNAVSKQVGKGALKRYVLSDINWRIPQKRHVVILGHAGAGKTLLLLLLAGQSVPTDGWIERSGIVSVPGGVVRYGRHGTVRRLILRMSEIYNVDPKQVGEFVSLFQPIRDLIDVDIQRLRGPIVSQLNTALTYAFPCDYYLFDGTFTPGRDPTFRRFCEEAFALRKSQSATIVATSSVRYARALAHEAMGVVLFQGRLYQYAALADAITAFENLPMVVPISEHRGPIAPDRFGEEDEH